MPSKRSAYELHQSVANYAASLPFRALLSVERRSLDEPKLMTILELPSPVKEVALVRYILLSNPEAA
jgi:hypothetical protein